MKKILLSVFALFVLSVPCFAEVSYDQYLYYSTPTASTNIELNLQSYNIDELSVQAFYSSATTGGVILSTRAYSFRWQYSNDGLNWYNSTASSITIFGTTTPTNYFWDFGFTTYKYIRASLIAGDLGSIILRIRPYGKRRVQ